MRYFIPEWDDLVDPDYDFSTDTHSEKHNNNPLINDNYIWDIFGKDNIPFDGLLISIATIKNKIKKFNQIKEKGVHNFFGLDKDFPIMADCGAFSYIKEEIPPYKTEDVLLMYKNMKVDYGVSIDHLVVSAFSEQKEERMNITYNNGIEAHKLWKKQYKDDFKLIVSVQGETTDDYINMYNKFLENDIKIMAFGGLVRSQTEFIVELINRIISEIKNSGRKPNYLHFFGLARPSIFIKMKELENLGVEVAFDSASPLRRAWLASASCENNYVSKEQKGYSAIRIPQKLTGKKKDLIPADEYQILSQNTLKAVQNYGKDKLDLDSSIKILSDFNEKINERPQILESYRKTLRDKPWDKCECPICSSTGIDTIIFRGNNRNRRRGFHNTKVFYDLLKNEELWEKSLMGNYIEDFSSFSKDENVLIITSCTKNKLEIPDDKPVAAKDLYLGTLFDKVKKYSAAMGYEYMIISAKYGLLSPDDKIKTYNKVLSKKSDADDIRDQVEEKLTPLLNDYDKILVIAGKNYREVLNGVIDDRFYILKKGGIGEMLHVLKDSLPKKDSELNKFL
ncbi:tRNA-guanine transglycosylase DpdA [Methanoplanus limicola]|uniref:DUF6884 domain-containing protein n=1 Tax=Methanoplanus limicola DSM 2279 TaxID=937775 RepID=H1Z0Q8_9EURY|nr:tRNA-guanine transglycosylase DpdA [Methanoplanus limicola]EHQ36201.1 hypothetical protein Metlim_2122 [Methanoplanus limicola DSM 2279]